MSRVRFWRQLCFPVACTLVGATSVVAWAQAQPTRFTLGYSAPARGCPARQVFLQAVSLRAPAARELPSGEAALALEVRLEGSSEQAKGTLAVRRSDGLSSRREVPTGSCSEVAESLAVIAAMLLEQREFEQAPQPSTANGVQPETAAQAANAPQAAATAQAESTPPPAEPAPSARPSALEKPPPARISSTPARPTSAATNARPALGLALTFASLVESEASPSLALGVLAGVEGFWMRDSLWSPSLRVAAYQVDAGREVTGRGDANFRLRALRLSACPLRWLAHVRLAVHVCAVLDAGQLRARGEVAGGKTLTMPWLAAGAGGRLALALFPVLELEGEVGLKALARHDEFVFEPNAFSVHSLAPVTLGASLGLTLRTF